MMRSTFMATAEDIERKWYVVDAAGKTLGRLATEVASLLRGKHKPIFTPHVDCGDYVIVINAEKVELTGDKWNKKLYIHHSGYPGGLKVRSANVMRDQFPERIVEMAVKGMLPKGKLGRAMGKKLFVYRGAMHPHQAQKPEVYELQG